MVSVKRFIKKRNDIIEPTNTSLVPFEQWNANFADKYQLGCARSKFICLCQTRDTLLQMSAVWLRPKYM